MKIKNTPVKRTESIREKLVIKKSEKLVGKEA